MAATVRPARYTATVWSPALIHGTVVRRRRRIVIDDHGVGLGAALASSLDAALTLDVERSLPRGDDLPDIVLRLDPLGSGESVSVLGPWSPTPRPCHPEVAAEWVLRNITRVELDDHGSSSHLHAGAVADERGRVAVLLGPSGAGKSTLVSHLVDRGLALISDEQVRVLTPFAVGGFTRPITIKAGGEEHLPPPVREVIADRRLQPGETTLVAPGDLGVRSAVAGTPTLLVSLSRFAEDSNTEDRMPMAPDAAFGVLCANSLDLVRDPLTAIQRFAKVSATVPMVSVGDRSSIRRADAVMGLLHDPPEFPAHPWSVEALDDDLHELRPGIAHRHPATLTIVVGGRHTLFDRRTRSLVRLNPAAARVWRDLPSIDGDPASWALVAELRSLGLVVDGATS